MALWEVSVTEIIATIDKQLIVFRERFILQIVLFLILLSQIVNTVMRECTVSTQFKLVKTQVKLVITQLFLVSIQIRENFIVLKCTSTTFV